jgi:hypothetical protein
MRNGQTKAYKVEHFERVERERDAFMLALHDVLNQDVAWSGWHREDGSKGSYRVGASRLDSPSGGLLIVVSRYPGQSDYATVHDADGFQANRWGLNDAVRDAKDTWHDSHMPAVASARI